MNKSQQDKMQHYEPIPIIIVAIFYDLAAILVRPLVGYIIFNIALLAVTLMLYESHRQSHRIHLTLIIGIGS